MSIYRLQEETSNYMLTDKCSCFSFDASVEHLKLSVMFKILLPHNGWNKWMALRNSIWEHSFLQVTNVDVTHLKVQSNQGWALSQIGLMIDKSVADSQRRTMERRESVNYTKKFKRTFLLAHVGRHVAGILQAWVILRSVPAVPCIWEDETLTWCSYQRPCTQSGIWDGVFSSVGSKTMVALQTHLWTFQCRTKSRY